VTCALLDRVSTAVARASGGAQIPEMKATRNNFYLTGPPPAKGTPAGEIQSNPLDKLEYVWIPPGTFLMGCVPDDTNCQKDELPRHKVTIGKGFWMGRIEVDVAAYQSYVNNNKKTRKITMPKPPQSYKSGWDNDSLPMVKVTWEEAQAFCNTSGGRLPTEAEWEHAARTGKDGLKYAWGEALSRDKANFEGSGGHDVWLDVAPTHKFDPNAWNLYDMSGNVWEWCSDWYDAAYYGQSGEAVDPPGPATGKEHVKRGGAYNSAEKQLRLSMRAKYSNSDNNTGFRCVVQNWPK
jgi:formylglycine-generating enzyme required for sulfatase activity